MKKVIFIFLLIIVSTGLNAQSWQSKITDGLWQKQTENDIQFVVYLKEQANIIPAKLIKNKNEKSAFVYNTLYNTSTKTQTNLIQILDNEQVLYQSFSIINAIWVKGDFDLIQKLAEQSEVQCIFYNSPIKGTDPVDINRNVIVNSRDSSVWGIKKINADDVWALGFKGQGIVVGGQDTGYGWQVPGIKEKYRGWNGSTANHNYSWHDAIHDWHPLHIDSINPCGLDVAYPCDDNGHGTHTIGTMIASDSIVNFGVAPSAQWIGCRNMERGWGSPQSYIECFEWFLAPTDLNNQNPDPTKSPHVINNSWSCPEIEGCDSSNFFLMEQAVENLRMAGVVVVVSAGNSGSNCHTIQTPSAMFEGSFSVGALHWNDTIANFSSRGSVMVDSSNRLKPNVTAPGVATTSYMTIGDGSGSWNYAEASGTSMAGPHVAGLIALMISADSTLAGDVNRIEDIIEKTAVQRTTDQNCGGVSGITIPNNTYGYGVIDALEAINQSIATSRIENINTGGQATVYPNPTSNSIWIKLDNFRNDTFLNLYSVDGKCVKQIKWTLPWDSLKQVDLQNLPIGIYFYKIHDNNSSFQGKIVKQ